ncbi:pseudouridine synthase [uncultured Paracoccus sp.]|uniref:pseudouridine synthase n=1 Tax=uncultured Paracoccus sp. TaxID=189685 RepID=UPI00263433FD|nr:pseudouridine synthase [uncultured Paracoccus sp.]
MTDQTPDEPTQEPAAEEPTIRTNDEAPDRASEQSAEQTASDGAEPSGDPARERIANVSPDDLVEPADASEHVDTQLPDVEPFAAEHEVQDDDSVSDDSVDGEAESTAPPVDPVDDEDAHDDGSADASPAEGEPGPTRRPAERVTSGGERIAKMMARAGVASRREAERMIVEGRVTVNGEKITSPALDILPSDRIRVDGKPMEAPQETRLWLYYKPLGLVTSESDEKGRQTVFDALPRDLPRVMSIGRLDINSEGLLLLTNDGELKRRLELPATGWLRRYRVRVNGNPSELTFDPLRRGAVIDGEEFQPMEIRLDSQKGANAWLTVGIREGRNREIRRAMAHVGLQVNRLIRIGYGPFRLEGLEENEVREIKRRVLRDQLGGLLTGDAEELPHSRGARRGAAETQGDRPAHPGGRDRSSPQDRPARGDRPERGDRPPRTGDDRAADRGGARPPRGGQGGSAERDDGRPARPEGGFTRKPRHGSAGASHGKPRTGGQGGPARAPWGERDRSYGPRPARPAEGASRTARGPGDGGAGKSSRDSRAVSGAPRPDRSRDADSRDRKPRTGGNSGGFGDRPRSGYAKPAQDGRPRDGGQDGARSQQRRSESRVEGDAPRAPRAAGFAGKPAARGAKTEGGWQGGRGESGRGPGDRPAGTRDRFAKPGGAGPRSTSGPRADRPAGGQPGGKPASKPGGKPGGYRGDRSGPRPGGKPAGTRPGGSGPRGPRPGGGAGKPRGPGGGGIGR